MKAPFSTKTATTFLGDLNNTLCQGPKLFFFFLKYRPLFGATLLSQKKNHFFYPEKLHLPISFLSMFFEINSSALLELFCSVKVITESSMLSLV